MKKVASSSKHNGFRPGRKEAYRQMSAGQLKKNKQPKIARVGLPISLEKFCSSGVQPSRVKMHAACLADGLCSCNCPRKQCATSCVQQATCEDSSKSSRTRPSGHGEAFLFSSQPASRLFSCIMTGRQAAGQQATICPFIRPSSHPAAASSPYPASAVVSSLIFFGFIPSFVCQQSVRRSVSLKPCGSPSRAQV